MQCGHTNRRKDGHPEAKFRSLQCFVNSLWPVLVVCGSAFVIADTGSLGSNPTRGTRICPSGKSKSMSFTRTRVKDPLNYSFKDQRIPEASCCKYLGIIIRSDLSWADQVNCTVQKAWKALHFIMPILKKGNKNTKSLAYTSLVRPILEYGAACWDPYRECRINAFDGVQKKAANLHIIRTV